MEAVNSSKPVVQYSLSVHDSHFVVGRRLKSFFLWHGLIPGRDFRFLTRRFVNSFVGKCNLLIYRVKM
jgi:hypothetical protein